MSVKLQPLNIHGIVPNQPKYVENSECIGTMQLNKTRADIFIGNGVNI